MHMSRGCTRVLRAVFEIFAKCNLAFARFLLRVFGQPGE